jgi:hypothetical protein
MRALIHRSVHKLGRVAGARVLVYLAQALRYRLRYGGPLPWSRLAADYGAWRDGQVRHSQPLADGLAWITYGAIEFLNSRLHRAMGAFEFGAGGSTIFVASRVGHLSSIEHDGAWVREVQEAAARLGLANANVLHVEAPPLPAATAVGDPDRYVSAQCPGRSFRTYAEAIDHYPDEGFHFILIDGRARTSCFKHALPKLAPGGIIMLDNAERPDYGSIRHTLDGLGWTRHDFAGAGPYNDYFWKTSAWIRPPR